MSAAASDGCPFLRGRAGRALQDSTAAPPPNFLDDRGPTASPQPLLINPGAIIIRQDVASKSDGLGGAAIIGKH
jgi:hypothetical protein